jgi:hypothetical protein
LIRANESVEEASWLVNDYSTRSATCRQIADSKGEHVKNGLLKDLSLKPFAKEIRIEKVKYDPSYMTRKSVDFRNVWLDERFYRPGANTISGSSMYADSPCGGASKSSKT